MNRMNRIFAITLKWIVIALTALILYTLALAIPTHAQIGGRMQFYAQPTAPVYCAQGRDMWINTSAGVPDGLRLNSCITPDVYAPVAYTYGITAPATCSTGQVFFDTDAVAGSNWFGCTATNTWTLLSGAGGGGNVTGPAAGTGGEIVTVSAAGTVLTRSALSGVLRVISGVPSAVPGTSTHLVRVDGTAVAPNLGDVVGPGSATDNSIVVFDSTTGKLIKVSGCTVVSGVLTCTSVKAGDGTASSGAIFPELTANGTNDFRIYGADNQSADGCIILTGQPADHAAITFTGTTATIDTKTCRVAQFTALPDCDDAGGNHINYDTATRAFSCGTSSSGGGGAAVYSHTWGCHRDSPGGVNTCDFNIAYSGGSTVVSGTAVGTTEASNVYYLLTNNATPTAGEKAGVHFKFPSITATSWIVSVAAYAQAGTTFELTSKISCQTTNTAAAVTLTDTKTVTTTTPTTGRYYDLVFTHTAPGCTSGQRATIVISAVDTVNVGIAEISTVIQ